MTIRHWMIAVAIIAIWLFIIAEGITYQARYIGNRGAWGSTK